MKTEYERMHTFSIDQMVFGKAKKRYRKFYLMLGILIPLIALVSTLIN